MIVSIRRDTQNVSFLKTVFCLGGMLFCSSVSAEILLREPGPDGRVSLLPENQKKIVQFQTQEERRAELEKDKKLRKFFEDLFENEVIADYLEENAFDDDPMDAIEDALDELVEGLEDNAGDIGEALEDLGLVWTMAVKGKDIILDAFEFY